jgi:hypothetical protein
VKVSPSVIRVVGDERDGIDIVMLPLMISKEELETTVAPSG